MDFQSINTLNVRLNLLSGNLLPMTENSSFSIFWKIYSLFVWLFELYFTVIVIAGCFFVSKEKAFYSGILVFVVIMEANVIVSRIYAQTELVRQLIRKLNDILNNKDENMRNIVMMNVKPMETPFKCYLVVGTVSVIYWCCIPLPLIFKKSTFYYSDFQVPSIYSREPFSTDVYLLGTLIVVISNIYIFIKKVSMDIYMTHLISLITAQYQYIALKFVLIFRNCNQQDNSSSLESHRTDSSVEKEIKSLCRQYNNILYITLMLRKLLSLNILFIYMNNVFRFCFLGVIISKTSETFMESFMVFMYGSGALTQFYILCNCFQKLSEATSEITDKAFHEDWNRFNLSIKRTFLMMIMASNNMNLKISLFENFNLSLPSLLSILNKAYSIAILLSKIN